VGRQSILRQFLDLAARSGPLRRILEVGCGSGGNFALLAGYGEVIGCERSETLARRARARGIATDVHSRDFFDLELSPSWDMTCMYDVLEHIENDGAFLRRLHGHVDPGHFLLLSVPACPFLYSEHDRLLHHYRRYTKSGLQDLLRANGFSVLRSTYFVTALFPIVALARIREKIAVRLGHRQREVNLGVVPGWLNRILTGVLRVEAAVARTVPLPFGVWVIVLARKE
jgi:SAM-dependent methyltransferase